MHFHRDEQTASIVYVIYTKNCFQVRVHAYKNN
jgi:hypothetical protein